MKLQLNVVTLYVSFILYIGCGLCGELLDGLNTLKWTCVCSAAPVGTNNYRPASNCSTSCHCTPDVGIGGDNEERWTCSCSPQQVPHESSIYDVSCFNSCNCTSGCIWRASIMFRRKRQTLFTCIIQFSYVELELATNKFSKEKLIGIGGSSNVYRGQLKDGKLVAVKKLKMVGGSDTDSEFLTEIELISRLNHRHVVPLLGYCIEYQGKQVERLLVFEYMSNGNLRECLDASKGKDSLDWGTRVKISLGVARGLEYLHEAAAPRILHRDVKSTNILLDDKYTAKISIMIFDCYHCGLGSLQVSQITDLGMAKRLMAEDFMSCTNSPARMLGTFGYFAPEYAIVGKASLKSDVFSFGVVILELITGRQPIHKSTNKGNESLVIWVNCFTIITNLAAAAKLCSSKLVVSELPDPLLKGNFPEEEMQMMAHLARECLHWDPDSRPSMSEVVQILSAVASDKVQRRNLSANFLMGPSSCSVRRSTASSVLQGCEDLREVCLEKVEVGQLVPDRAHARCSLSSPVDQSLCDKRKEHDEQVFCDGDTDGLMLLTSSARSSHAPEDEIVDLTEPRFESFMQDHIQVSPLSP
ncbi:hypothetical protein Taro_032636 [Colocasia esculenta]|uniref:Protein kinase domain-containing protein n=1 Tax=Colocasia esculenta TaxID=4460 RepID=A0A843WA18_COLES|nr:hypothetical protein [Colocasia esculenta]